MKIKTAKAPPPPPPETISHPFHPEHELKHVTTDDGDEFVCDGCKERGAAGGARYTCEACDVDLHTGCALAPEVLKEHALFHGCAFVLLHEPPPVDPGGRRVCDACGDEPLGFVYHCFDRDLDLHPCCARLPGRIALGGLAFDLRGGSDKAPRRRCALCSGKGRRRQFWTYRSDCDGEALYLHVACVKEMANGDSGAGHGSRVQVDSGGQNLQLMRAPVLNGVLLPSRARTSSSKWKRYLKIVGVVLRVIVGVIFGDPTAMIVAIAGVVFNNG